MTERFENRSARGRAPDDDEESLRERLASTAVRSRRDAVLGLVDAATDGIGKETVAALREAVRSDPDPEVRQFAVEALGNAGVADEAVGAALADDDEAWVRAEAVVALSRSNGADAAPRLREALADEDGFVRRNAMVALAKLGAVDADLLRERLQADGNDAVREYAADFLREHPGEETETVRILAAVLARDPAAYVRAKAARSLGALGTDRAVEALENHGVADRSEAVVAESERALAEARGGDPDAIDADPSRTPPGGGPDTPVDPDARGSRPRATEPATDRDPTRDRTGTTSDRTGTTHGPPTDHDSGTDR